MTAFQQLAAFYEADPSIGDMEIDIAIHQELGYAYFSPDNIALARPVCTSWPDEWLQTTAKTTALTDSPDCWYVWAAIGDLKYLLSLIPYPLPYIAFVRRRANKASSVRFYDFHRLIAMGGSKPPPVQQAAPPVYATGIETTQASQQAKLLEKRKKGLASTQLEARPPQPGQLLGSNGTV